MRRGRYLQTSQQAKGLVYILSQALLAQVFSGEYKRLEKMKLALARKNLELQPEAINGFVHRMIFFSIHPEEMSRGAPRAVPHPSLISDLEQYHLEVKKNEQDRMRITQGLSVLLRDCKTAQDIRDALPNSMSDLLDQTKRLPRTRSEAYTLEDKPIQQAQYKPARDLMEVFMMTRAMY
jgi:hypothetical protein